MKRSGGFGSRILRRAALLAVFSFAAFTLYRYLTANLQLVRAMSCKERIHGISQALQMYCQDYDDKLPVASRWMDSLHAYIPKVPSDKYAPRFDSTSVFQCPEVAGQGTSSYGYAFNKTLSASRLRQIAAPSNTPLIYDSSSSERNANNAFASLPAPPRHERYDPPHAFNYVGYADGHIRAIIK